MTTTEEHPLPGSTTRVKEISGLMTQESLRWLNAINALQESLTALEAARAKGRCDCRIRDFRAWLAEDQERAQAQLTSAAVLESDMDLLDAGMSLEQLAAMRKLRSG